LSYLGDTVISVTMRQILTVNGASLTS